MGRDHRLIGSLNSDSVAYWTRHRHAACATSTAWWL